VPRAHAVVDAVQDLLHAVEFRETATGRPSLDYLTVAFADGRTGLLDMTIHRSVVWADVLASLRETGQPAYVEIEPDTGLITLLLLPIRYTVARIEPDPEGLEVELVVSHAGHYVRRSNSDFDELRERLQAALERRTPVLVTETLDEHEIIDVRPLETLTEAKG
jgi:glycine/D-amino acid oxidase-like deaminating enzyme